MNIVNKSLTYSAILTTYNAEDTVIRAINSIIGQDITPNEIIIIDDNSKDSTVKLVSEIADKNSIIQFHSLKENIGQSAARNFGAKKASGDVLIFFDDDDYSHPNRARSHISMQQDSELSYVSSRKIYSNGYQLEFRNRETSLTLEIEPWVKKLTMGIGAADFEELWVPSSTSAFSKDFFMKIGGFDEEMRRLEDVAIFLESAKYEVMARWSPTISVDRFDSSGFDKGGAIDINFEKKLLVKFKNYLPVKDYKFASKLIRFRKYYFEKKYIMILIYGVFNLNLILRKPTKIRRFLRRVIHDMRKKN